MTARTHPRPPKAAASSASTTSLAVLRSAAVATLVLHGSATASSPGGFAALAFASPSRPPAFGFGPPAGVCSGTPLSRDHIGLGLLPLAGGAAGPLHLAAAAGDAQEYPTPEASNEKGSAVVAEDNEGGVGCDWRSVADSVFESDDRPVILFDGLCNLCNGGVNFALDHDEDGSFRFASLQSTVGQSLLLRSGKAAGDRSSIVLVTPTGAHFRSDAVVQIAGGLRGGPYAALTGAVAALGPLTPAPVADWLYGGVAANRYRFGEADQCRLWDDGFDDRFVPDPGGLESTEG